jgi:signal transduction histidine kinase
VVTSKYWSRWTPILIAVGVLVPALVLAAIGALLTLRTARAVENASARHNLYMTRMVDDGLKQALFDLVHGAIAVAENVARSGQSPALVREALQVPRPGLAQPTLFEVDKLMDMEVDVVEGQPLIYTFDPARHPGRVFAGTLLYGRDGEVIGAGGWWVDVRRFLVDNLTDVVDRRLPDNPLVFGGPESMSNLSVQLLGPGNQELARVREPGQSGTARTLELEGPFHGFSVRVAALPTATVSWISEFVGFELGLIALMLLVIAFAMAFGLRYTAQQLQLASHKASFVSNVSHELKTPLSLIRLAVETLEMGRVRSAEDRERFLRTIGREAQRLNQLVDNILDFARLEAGRREFHFAPTDLTAVTREVLDSFRARLEEQGFHLEVALPADLPPARADAAAIGQCLINLLDNAIKYSRDRKEIRVTGEARGAFVALTVADRGVGIATQHQRRVFEQFVRLNESLVHDIKGAGLGLALVDHIVRAHGGRIELKSVPDEGSAFTILLPVAETVPAAHAERAAPALNTG